jgi:hydrogenase-4 component D
MELKSPWGIIFVVLILLESMTAFLWFLRIGQKVFFGESKINQQLAVPAVFQWLLLLLVVLSLAAPFLGFVLLKGIG